MNNFHEILINQLAKESSFAEKTIDYNSDKYRLTGVPFYTNKEENEFITAFEESLK
jgi:hypothetical protein